MARSALAFSALAFSSAALAAASSLAALAAASSALACSAAAFLAAAALARAYTHGGPGWGATVRGTYPTPEAGTRTQYVLYVGPWGRAALCVRYVPNAGGWYA